MNLVRWIVFLPCAALAGYLAYFIGGVINRIGFIYAYGGPASSWYAVALDVLGHIYMGAAFNYVGARIAPKHPVVVSACLSGVALLLAGASIFAALLGRSFMVIAATTGFIAGSVAVTVSAFRGELGFQDRRSS